MRPSPLWPTRVRTDEARTAALAAREAAVAKGFVNGVRWADARLAALDALEPA